MTNLKEELCGAPHLDMLFLTQENKIKDIELAWNEKNSAKKSPTFEPYLMNISTKRNGIELKILS